jgi:hypothetical protein
VGDRQDVAVVGDVGVEVGEQGGRAAGRHLLRAAEGLAFQESPDAVSTRSGVS